VRGFVGGSCDGPAQPFKRTVGGRSIRVGYFAWRLGRQGRRSRLDRVDRAGLDDLKAPIDLHDTDDDIEPR
jgi:hypothetical protein